MAITGENFWGESNDPNQARELLKNAAKKSGANAVVCMTLNKYTQSNACSNYKYTMHRFYGHGVVVKRVDYSSDPHKISQSRREMSRYQSMTPRFDVGESKMVRPPAVIFYPALMYFWLLTIMKIISIAGVYVVARAIGVRKRFIKTFIRKYMFV